MKKHNPTLQQRRRSNGAVTIFITLMILIAVTIGSFAVVETTTTESQLIGNDWRAKQALQNAQKGVDYVVAALSTGNLQREDLCDNYPANVELAIAFCNETNFSAIALMSSFDMQSRGFSEDGESIRTIMTKIDLWHESPYIYRTQQVGGGGAEAVISLEDVAVSGNTDISRCSTAAECAQVAASPSVSGSLEANDPIIVAGGTVTTGGSTSVGGTNFTETDPSLDGYKSSDGSVDLNAFFRDKVSDSSSPMTLDDFKNSPNTASVTTNNLQANIPNSNQISVTGDLRLNTGTIGSQNNPVILVVQGDLFLAGNVTIWGTVFVTGKIDSNPNSQNTGGPGGAGRSTVMGSLIAAGDVDLTGRMSVVRPGAVPVPTMDPALGVATLSADREAYVRIGSWVEIATPPPTQTSPESTEETTNPTTDDTSN